MWKASSIKRCHVNNMHTKLVRRYIFFPPFSFFLGGGGRLGWDGGGGGGCVGISD